MKTLILLYALIKELKSKCDKGCLLCGANEKCKICDISNLYKLDQAGTTCVQVPASSNCYMIDTNDVCIQCNQGYLPSVGPSNSVTCVKVSVAVNHCIQYNMYGDCVACKSSFFWDFEEKKCQYVSEPLANCLTMSSASTCARCASGYFLNNQNTCTAAVSPKCIFHSNIDCVACQPGYYLNPTFQATAELYKTELFIFKLNLLKVPSSKEGQNIMCFKNTIANCLQQTNINLCFKCQSGYFLSPDKAQCVKNPPPAINNCKDYLSETECRECLNGFFVSNKLCAAVVPVAQCALYDGKASASVCLECAAGYSLSSGACAPVSTSIPNCKLHATDASLACRQCDDGYQPAPDSMACFKTIDNCEVYGFQPASSPPATLCTKCRQGYRLQSSPNASSCVKIAVENCVLAELTSDSPPVERCLACSNAFFLDGAFACQRQPPIDSCQTYSGTSSGVCQTCKDNFFLFSLVNRCGALAKPIENCLEYASPSSCSVCANYFALNAGRCEQISILHCQKAVYDTAGSAATQRCTACEPFYTLWQNACIPPEHNVVDNCKVFALDGGQKPTCDLCNNYYLKYPFTQAICQDAAQFFEPSGGQAPIAGCSVYDGDKSCVMCLKNMLLKNNQACITSDACEGVFQRLRVASSSSKFFAAPSFPSLTYFVDRKNICKNVAGTILSSCEVIANSNEDGSEVCVKCAARTAQVITDDPLKTSIVNDLSGFKAPIAISKHPIVTCQTSQNMLSGCQYYRNDTKLMGCQKCVHGKMPYTNSTGMIFDCVNFVNCIPTIVYSGLSYWANLLFSCHSCTSGVPVAYVKRTPEAYAYVKRDGANVCEVLSASSVISQCLLYFKVETTTDAFALECASCTFGYTLSADRKSCIKISFCMNPIWISSCGNCDAGYSHPLKNG